LVEDDSVRVDVDAAGIDACALGLDECDAMLHRCAVFLLEVKKMFVTTVALVESGVVEVEHAFWTLYEVRGGGARHLARRPCLTAEAR
jgi:hypothetical protein